MKIVILSALLLFFVFVTGCQKPVSNFEECVAVGNPVMESYPRQCNHQGKNFVEEIPGCTKELKVCPDGSSVGRVPPNCEFETCPSEGEIKYISRDPEECSRIQFLCEPNFEPFSDDKGCGCKKITDEPNLQENYCTPESREADACITLYKPVCGWNDPEKIQCVWYPCAQTFSNSCFACMDENVLYWTEGECPT